MIHAKRFSARPIITAIIALFLAAGCAQKSATPASRTANTAVAKADFTNEESKPTTKPSGKAFTSNMTVKLSDAVPIPKLRKEAEQLVYAYKIEPPNAARTLYFGELTNNDELTLPLVIIGGGGKLRAIRVESQYGEDLWQRVLIGPNENEIWGVLDQGEDDRIEKLTLAHSTDGGATWQMTTIRKPSAEGSFYDFVMSRDGHGRLTVEVQEAEDKKNQVKPGLYHYRTTDGGKTWTASEFEPDQTKPADEVPEEEQPDKGATA